MIKYGVMVKSIPLKLNDYFSGRTFLIGFTKDDGGLSMKYYKPGMKGFILSVLMLSVAGCVPMQMTEGSDVLSDKGAAPKQAIQQKDVEINKLKELVDDQQRQLRELNDQLNECKGKK